MYKGNQDENFHCHEAFNRKIWLLTSKLNIELSKNFVGCYVWSIALYGPETWTLRKLERNKTRSIKNLYVCEITIHSSWIHWFLELVINIREEWNWLCEYVKKEEFCYHPVTTYAVSEPLYCHFTTYGISPGRYVHTKKQGHFWRPP